MVRLVLWFWNWNQFWIHSGGASIYDGLAGFDVATRNNKYLYLEIKLCPVYMNKWIRFDCVINNNFFRFQWNKIHFFSTCLRPMIWDLRIRGVLNSQKFFGFIRRNSVLVQRWCVVRSHSFALSLSHFLSIFPISSVLFTDIHWIVSLLVWFDSCNYDQSIAYRWTPENH